MAIVGTSRLRRRDGGQRQRQGGGEDQKFLHSFLQIPVQIGSGVFAPTVFRPRSWAVNREKRMRASVTRLVTTTPA
jgi:hypothetical protein